MKHWKVNGRSSRWLYLYAPIMEGNLSFTIKKQLVKELRVIEKTVQYPTQGWIIRCKLTHPHIMIMLLKVGAIPYTIKDGVIWFKKELE